MVALYMIRGRMLWPVLGTEFPVVNSDEDKNFSNTTKPQKLRTSK